MAGWMLWSERFNKIKNKNDLLLLVSGCDEYIEQQQSSQSRGIK